MGTCSRCKNEGSENDFRFAVVATASTSETQNYVVAKKTTTHIYEKLLSVERNCICDSCIKKERRMYVLKWTGFIALFILCVLVVAALKAGAFGLWILIVLGIGTAIGGVCVLMSAINRKDAFFAADIRSAAASKNSSNKYRYVSVDSGLYCPKGTDKPSLQTFKEKSGLRTTVADKIFERFIAPGNGNELVDSMIASQRESN